MDRIDGALLRALQSNGRATNADLSAQVNLSESACFRRVRALEADGVVERYAAIVDQRSVGLPLNVFLSITLVSQAEEVLSAFEAAVARVPEVELQRLPVRHGTGSTVRACGTHGNISMICAKWSKVRW